MVTPTFVALSASLTVPTWSIDQSLLGQCDSCISLFSGDSFRADVLVTITQNGGYSLTLSAGLSFPPGYANYVISGTNVKLNVSSNGVVLGSVPLLTALPVTVSTSSKVLTFSGTISLSSLLSSVQLSVSGLQVAGAPVPAVYNLPVTIKGATNVSLIANQSLYQSNGQPFGPTNVSGPLSIELYGIFSTTTTITVGLCSGSTTLTTNSLTLCCKEVQPVFSVNVSPIGTEQWCLDKTISVEMNGPHFTVTPTMIGSSCQLVINSSISLGAMTDYSKPFTWSLLALPSETTVATGTGNLYGNNINLRPVYLNCESLPEGTTNLQLQLQLTNIVCYLSDGSHEEGATITISSNPIPLSNYSATIELIETNDGSALVADDASQAGWVSLLLTGLTNTNSNYFAQGAPPLNYHLANYSPGTEVVTLSVTNTSESSVQSITSSI